MSRKNVFITIVVVLIGAAVVAANVYYKKDKGLAVTTDVIKARDLEAIVSASGKIQPKRLVNISADTPGRVVNLAVNEGDRIHKGQFLLQIDPKSLQHPRRQRHRVAAGEHPDARADAPVDRDRARPAGAGTAERSTRQQDLWKQQLTTREALDKADNDVKVAQSALQEREKTAEAAGEPHRAGARRRSKARATISARCGSNRRSTASSPAGTSRKAKPRSSAR